jgi:hypothetical protein
MDLYRGTIKFNSDKEILIYAPFSTKYLSVYQVEDKKSAQTVF